MSDTTRNLRLPSFNDFSPGILGKDIRRPLRIVADAQGDRDVAVKRFASEFFSGNANKRSITNVPVTLINTGLVDSGTFLLTDFGLDVVNASSPLLAAREFVKRMILDRNGILLIEAIRTLYYRREVGSRKALLKRELENLGVEGLSNATTDHTTLENWMMEAGVVVQDGQYRRPDDDVLRDLIGADSDDLSAILAMEPGPRLFLEILRRCAETAGHREYIPLKPVYSECLRRARAWFDEDQLRKNVVDPLLAAGWIEAPAAKSGKGGSARASDRLLRMPLDKILPHMFGAIPGDLRGKLTLPLPEVRNLLYDKDSKNNRGIGLELLALRMLLALALEPRGFRQRARDTSFAEVDLLAEGRDLLFSRWVVQCKNLKESSKVQLSEVAKEVGIAIHQKAHVVVVVTTTDFTSEARKYADEITRETHLQFLLVPGDIVRGYLSGGEARLLEFVMNNAAHVMAMKRGQLDGAIHWSQVGGSNVDGENVPEGDGEGADGPEDT
ncbi:restriction endonuclease [Solidesulfovibrio sp. C21]|uniref:restriction endonuclease n=1 Tax=Solidesulfovibrio sp. C21 TaxID=3398613 RepID=UPI0039FCAC3E